MTRSIYMAVAAALAFPVSLSHAQEAAEGTPAAVSEPATESSPAAEPPAAAAAAAAAAADAESPTDAVAKRPGTKSRLIEEIIVTAQKREEALMDVPISVQAFSPESLEARGVSDQMGLSKVVAGMDIGSQAGFATLFIRGIGTDAWLTADPSVAAYIDGVYFSFTPSIIQEFGAVERVEVLKGPQGTLFGRNAVGGAINVITKDPDFSQQETTVQAGYQSFDTYKSRMYTNVPLTDDMAVNVSAFYNVGDSWLKGSTSANKPLNREVSSGARFKFRWAPMEDLDMKFALMRTHGQVNGALPVNSNPSPLGIAVGVPSGANAAGPYETHVDERLYLNTDSTVYSAEIVKNFNWFDFKLLGSDQKHTAPYNYDFDASERPIVSFDIPMHYGKIQEAEMQFLSNEGTPGADWLTITAGMFYYQNEQGFDPIRITVANLDPRNLDAAGINLPPELQASLDETFGPNGSLGGLLTGLGIPSAGVPFYTVSNTALIETHSWSQYLQMTAKLTDWASLTLGGRYQHEKRGVKESNTNIATPQGVTLRAINWTEARDSNGNPLGPGIPLSDVTKGFKPKVAIDLHPFEDDTLVYASYQEAVKAHAYNAYAIYLRPAYVKAEETSAYEVGLKSTLFEGTTRVAVAGFYYDTKNVQTQFVSLINGGAVSFENAGTAKSKGFDFDIASSIFPSLIDGVAATINGAYIDAHYTKYPSGSGYNETTKIFSSNNDYSGNRQVRSPKFSTSAALTKTWTVDSGSLEVGASYYYNTGFFYTASNDPDYEQPKFSLVGAHISYHYDPLDMGIKVFGENLADKFYTNGLLVTDFGPNYAVAPPRIYGVTFDWTF